MVLHRQQLRSSLRCSLAGSVFIINNGFALLEIRLLLAGIVRKFEFVVPEAFDSSSMDVRDRWLIFPKGHSLKLNLIERED